MDSGTVQTNVARVLSGERVADAALPHERLEMFRGFLTKVRHNALRSELPRTLRLLQRSGMEIAFFAVYASDFSALRHAGAAKEARIDGLLEALDRFTARRLSLRHLFAVARHEALCARDPAPVPPKTRRGRGLALAADIRIVRYDADPRADEPANGPVFLLYRPNAAVIELTVEASLLLSLLDGTAGLQVSVARAVERTGADPSAIGELYRQALANGITAVV